MIMFRKCIENFTVTIKLCRHSFSLQLVSLISTLCAFCYVLFYYIHIKPYEFDGYKIFVIYASLSFTGLLVVILSCLIFIVLFLLKKKFKNIPIIKINHKLYTILFYFGLIMYILFIIITLIFIFCS